MFRHCFYFTFHFRLFFRISHFSSTSVFPPFSFSLLVLAAVRFSLAPAIDFPQQKHVQKKASWRLFFLSRFRSPVFLFFSCVSCLFLFFFSF